MPVGTLLFSAILAHAGSIERREYAITINGKDAGQSSLTILQQDNGKIYMQAKVSAKYQLFLIPFTYTTEIQEWWDNGRLTNLKATTTENSKKTEVSAKAEVDRLLVSVNGQIHAMSWEAWTSSFWKLAERRFHNNPVSVLEVDTGKDLACKLEYVGTEKITVSGQPEDCYHFRVVGTSTPTELWYDKHHRLVRQAFTDSNVRTIIHLVSRKH